MTKLTFECALERPPALHKDVLFSHKSRKPVYRCEIGIAIFGGDIISVREPIPEEAGIGLIKDFSHLDITPVDDENKSNISFGMVTPSKTRDREVLVHKMIMLFKILNGYRHKLGNHRLVLQTIVVLVELFIMIEVPELTDNHEIS